MTRSEAGWTATEVGPEGKGRVAHDIVIPPWIDEAGVGRFLADLLHESASPDKPDVVRLHPAQVDGRADVEIRVEPAEDLGPYSEVSIAFVTDRALFPVATDGGIELRETALPHTIEKDYDREPGHHPSVWSTRFDTSAWTVLAAWIGSSRVGGAIVVHGSDEIDMLEGRDDLAVIWDLRVAREARGRGIGSRLIDAAGDWARSRGCTELKVETQHINVAACRVYERSGFVLRSADHDAYPELPDEIQLLWYKTLRPPRDAGAAPGGFR